MIFGLLLLLRIWIGSLRSGGLSAIKVFFIFFIFIFYFYFLFLFFIFYFLFFIFFYFLFFFIFYFLFYFIFIYFYLFLFYFYFLFLLFSLSDKKRQTDTWGDRYTAFHGGSELFGDPPLFIYQYFLGQNMSENLIKDVHDVAFSRLVCVFLFFSFDLFF